jgi:hypothetical protein
MSGQTFLQKLDSPQWRLESIPMLSPEECERACDAVLETRSDWRRRHPVCEFFTLGVASYLDASDGRFPEYREHALRLNPCLYRRFDWLYRRLESTMSAFTGESVSYDEELAHPGFHIFLGNESQEHFASRHYDLQDRNIDWSRYRSPESDRHLSFTLVLRLPTAGSGLYVWDVNDNQLQAMIPQDRHEYLELHQTPTYHPYQIGELVIHDGHYLHQIARIRQMCRGDQRITLQGHSLRTEKGWVLYW